MDHNSPPKLDQALGKVPEAQLQAQSSGLATSSSGPSSRTHSRTPIRKFNPPSCNLCRQRKIKCNRADPCSHCVRVGATCVSSAPSGMPRGRQGGRRRKLDSELLDRIAKLENLVKDIEGGSPGIIPAVPVSDDGSHTVWYLHVSLISILWPPAELIPL